MELAGLAAPGVGEKLRALISRRALSRFHALLQDAVAGYLYSLGYDVEVEYRLPDGLVCDVYAESPWETLIVEVETGYVPPRHLHRAQEYLEARIARKILQYSVHADRFAIATPAHLRLPVPRGLLGRPGPGEPGLDAVILVELRGQGPVVRVLEAGPAGAAGSGLVPLRLTAPHPAK